jgi:hypothetical protein
MCIVSPDFIEMCIVSPDFMSPDFHTYSAMLLTSREADVTYYKETL